ncbi:MAG: VCBS repeat-containing protein [Myxococcales bacterium]|nr:VCBS repeat-containing protein [Myxococcales bacterium]
MSAPLRASLSLCLLAVLARPAAGNPKPSWQHLSSAAGQLPPPGTSTQQTGSLAGDLDGDGVPEFVVAMRKTAPALVFYRRSAHGWSRHVIEPAKLAIEAGGTSHDIDGDGDLDLVFGQDASGADLWWWENPAPDVSKPWHRRLIKSGGAHQHHDQVFADFLGLKRPQLVFWNQGAKTLYLAPIPPNPRQDTPWPLQVVYAGRAGEGEESAASYPEGAFAFDVDGDERPDLLAGNAWFKVDKGQWRATRVGVQGGRIVAGRFRHGSKVAQIVIAPGDGSGPLMYYECTGNPLEPACWKGRALLDRDLTHGHSLAVADIDGDGHEDIFAAEMAAWGPCPADCFPEAEAFVLYGNGRGGFRTTKLVKGHGWHEPQLGDFDGDGDLDILNKPYTWQAPRVDLWLQNGTRPRVHPLPLAPFRRHALDALKARGMFVRTGDLNGDGWIDVAVADRVYLNPGSLSAPWVGKPIGAPLRNVAALLDIDGDGDLDVLGTQGEGAARNPAFAWARNDGQASFTVFTNIPVGSGDFLQGVAFARFRHGGPLEIALSWHDVATSIEVLTVPADPTSPWALRPLGPFTEKEELTARDLDGDGDEDLFLGNAWLENPGTPEGPWPPHVIGEVTQPKAEPDRHALGDFDGDGRVDAVVGLEEGTDLLLFSAGKDPRKPWRRRVIGHTPGGGFSMGAADFDGDGDLDVVVGEHRGVRENHTWIFVNDGKGRFTRRAVDVGDAALIDHHDGSVPVDLDGDGDLDVVSVGWYTPTLWVLENRALVK